MKTSRIRVAHLVQHLAIGGLERMAASLAQMGNAQGVDAILVGYLGESEFRQALTQRGVRTAMLRTSPGIALGFPFRLARWLVQERVDVLHTHHLGPFIYGFAAAHLARVAHVHTEHSHEFYDVPRRRALGRAMPRLSRTIAVTEQVAAFHQATLGNTIEVIENGVAIGPAPDATARANARALLGFDEKVFVVGCVARLAEEKRHDRLLQAFARMQASAHLVLVGNGPQYASLVNQAEALGIADRTHFLGARSDPEALLPGLDVLTLTSDREGLPMSLLEGMAASIPVVATAVGGIPTLLKDDAGIAVAATEVDLFAAALDALAADPHRRMALGARGRARALAHHSLEAMSAAYVEVYREELRRCA